MSSAQSSSETKNRLAPAPFYPSIAPVIPDLVAYGTAGCTLDEMPLADLQSADFSVREAAVRKLVRIGDPALPVLRAYAGDVDPDVQWWIQSAIQQIEGVTVCDENVETILAQLASGPAEEVLTLIQPLSPTIAGELVDLHLRLELGMDCIYSLRPNQVLPRAITLLNVQTNSFYQALLLRLIRNNLERALLPIPGFRESGDPMLGIDFVRMNPAVEKSVRPYLKHTLPLLRREALLIMARGRIKLDSSEMDALLRDSDPSVAREARRLQTILVNTAPEPDPDMTAWIKCCVAALSQDEDGLAQLGAYYALYELVYDAPAELAAAALAGEGRTRDAISWLLSQSPGGRAHLLYIGSDHMPVSRPSGLDQLMILRDYDLLRRKLETSKRFWPAETRALIWRNLVNDEAGGYSQINKGTAIQKMLDEFSIYGPVSLGDAGRSEMIRPPRVPEVHSFDPWYEACSIRIEAERLSIATGAIRGLLVSDRSGAQALVKRYGDPKTIEMDPALSGSLARDLLMMHPCIDLLYDRELSPELRSLWRKRRIPKIPKGNGDPKLVGLPINISAGLWGFMMQNDCSYMNPVGRYLADVIAPDHVPLLMAFLEYNPRATIFLSELDAEEAIPAITREVVSRRTSYYLSYDHDLFRGVAHFGILDAAPVLDTYARQNRNWPAKGIVTVAGYEMSRYCWTEDAPAAMPSPLAAGILNEIIVHLEADRITNGSQNDKMYEFCTKGLIRMEL